jgi:hypothetical protein
VDIGWKWDGTVVVTFAAVPILNLVVDITTTAPLKSSAFSTDLQVLGAKSIHDFKDANKLYTKQLANPQATGL